MIKIKTPCVGICSTSLGDSVCRGCKRFNHEVINWNSYTESQKALIEKRLSGYLTMIIQNKCRIFDEDLLRWQITQQPIDVPTQRNLYCQAFVLMKSGASQITSPESFGIRLLPEHRHWPLKTLCKHIDEEFYTLSLAEYERCFVNFS